MGLGATHRYISLQTAMSIDPKHFRSKTATGQPFAWPGCLGYRTQTRYQKTAVLKTVAASRVWPLAPASKLTIRVVFVILVPVVGDEYGAPFDSGLIQPATAPFGRPAPSLKTKPIISSDSTARLFIN